MMEDVALMEELVVGLFKFETPASKDKTQKKNLTFVSRIIIQLIST